MRTPRVWRDEHERKRWERGELERQRDEDRGDFYRYFRPKDDLRTITGQRGLQTIHEYLADILDFVHWNLPTTNDDVRRVLCDVVRSGRLVPYMDREWTRRPRVFRLTPAPQFRQSASASGGGNANRPLTWDEWVAFKAAQEGKVAGAGSALPTAFDVPSQVAKAATGLTQAVSGAASSSEGDGGAGLLGFVASAAGALFVSGDSDSDGNDAGSDVGGTFDNDLFSADSSTDSTPLSDAQPFGYQPQQLNGDVAELAKSTNNPDYAAKMLGYDRDTFGDMVHVMKDDLDLRGDDNVIWHDSGDIEFRKNIIGNMHDYAF
ncbi:hypothetical protein [Paraburkholderia acidiphila]|uniref:Uncharacterized protein n=1 Tax=Paraburkholderia acidiphila TaxID=2571747 RepID=A0A7Z2GB37_9BURK|nr:hypothetical protein [Paraburkholderia acidiphila]QGZ58471.1 hypothetical protein FAZ97_26125 [Paraburkholderia acidiphila]